MNRANRSLSKKRSVWLHRIIIAVIAAAISWRPSPAHGGSSNSLLDVSRDGKRLLVANSDNGTVTVVDIAARRALHEIQVGEKPEGVTWIGDGPLGAVTVYREDKVIFFDAENGLIVHTLSVADEPYGIVANKAGNRAWVTHEYPGTVSEIDLTAKAVLREMKVGSFIRGLSLSTNEERLYVTEFHTARLHALDLATGKVIDTWHNRSEDNLARQVVLHPRRPKAYLPHLRSIVTAHHGAGSIFPHLTVMSLSPTTAEKRQTSLALDSFYGIYVATNPWEAAVSPDGARIYIVFAGTDDLFVAKIIDDDYREVEPLSSPIRVGKNPRAVRLSPDGTELYVYNTLDFSISVYDAEPPVRLRHTIKVCDPPKTPAWVRGKILFSSAKPPLTVRRWIACASCHPDGHSDARVWQQPEGLRKTPPLFGLAHTHPLHWSADRDEVQDFEYTIRGKLMQGGGLVSGSIKPKDSFRPTELDEVMAERSQDLDALAIYTNSFGFTLSPHIDAPGKLSQAAQRGKSLFLSEAVGCSKCHSGPYFTDSTLSKPFKLHDVGTGEDDPTEKIGPRFDTPTLLAAYRSAPYLHHGKAKDLLQVLTTHNKQDKHGRTSHLRKEDLDDLVEFLKSLPYEMPPGETPNAVKYRVTPPTK
jgi:YVTN family beta-propeller protein